MGASKKPVYLWRFLSIQAAENGIFVTPFPLNRMDSEPPSRLLSSPNMPDQPLGQLIRIVGRNTGILELPFEGIAKLGLLVGI